MTSWMMTERSAGDGPLPHPRARVAAVARRLPAHRLTTEELMASTRHRTRIDLERLTGVHERRVSHGEDDSLTLATGAARTCLDDAGCDPAELDLVLSCSITKYRDGLDQWLEPTMARAVADDIGAGGAQVFDVANACAGVLTGVFVAANRIAGGAAERVLVVSGEYISQLGLNAARHVRTIASRELASLTLGDAGVAVLVERAGPGQPGIEMVGFTTVADHSRLCLAYPSRHEPGARMFTRSQTLQRAAIADTPALLQEALGAAGLEMGDIDHVIPHQTSVRAIHKGMRVVTAALGGQPRNPVVVTVDRYGNTASTTHIVALVEELEAGRIVAGDRVALVALASGIEIGVVLLVVDDGLVGSSGHAA